MITALCLDLVLVVLLSEFSFGFAALFDVELLTVVIDRVSTWCYCLDYCRVRYLLRVFESASSLAPSL